eukprot:scaffold32285_cov130-Isochrysis_galbana.AAC.7
MALALIAGALTFAEIAFPPGPVAEQTPGTGGDDGTAGGWGAGPAARDFAAPSGAGTRPGTQHLFCLGDAGGLWGDGVWAPRGQRARVRLVTAVAPSAPGVLWRSGSHLKKLRKRDGLHLRSLPDGSMGPGLSRPPRARLGRLLGLSGKYRGLLKPTQLQVLQVAVRLTGAHRPCIHRRGSSGGAQGLCSH